MNYYGDTFGYESSFDDEYQFLKIQNKLPDYFKSNYGFDEYELKYLNELQSNDEIKRHNKKWTKTKNELPNEGIEVWYYFDIIGVASGQIELNEHGVTFYGKRGLLTNDVTHWMFKFDDNQPNPPIGD